jgi:hypothetical protein
VSSLIPIIAIIAIISSSFFSMVKELRGLPIEKSPLQGSLNELASEARDDKGFMKAKVR